VQSGEPAAPKLELGDVKARAEEIVGDVLRLMGFEAGVVVDEDAGNDEVIVRVTADAEGLLIGRRGQTLDAFEHLVNRAVAPRETAESRVVVDVGGYRDRRRESLVELAARLRERALKEGRRVQVSPMSPRDRKIFHDALEGDTQVSARSLGTGFYRRVLIVPEGVDDSGSSDAPRDEDLRETAAAGSPRTAEQPEAGDEAPASEDVVNPTGRTE
jgi:spoIIIJ-associated protein